MGVCQRKGRGEKVGRAKEEGMGRVTEMGVCRGREGASRGRAEEEGGGRVAVRGFAGGRAGASRWAGQRDARDVLDVR